MTDNQAELTYSDDVLKPKSGVEAVRVRGSVGTFLRVQGLDLSGMFRVGVLVSDSQFANGTEPPFGLRYVSDVLNRNLAEGVGLEAPGWVWRERCLP